MNVPQQPRNSSIFSSGLCWAHFSCSQEDSLHSLLRMTQQIVLTSGKIFSHINKSEHCQIFHKCQQKLTPATYYLCESSDRALTRIPTFFNLPLETRGACQHRIPRIFLSRNDFREKLRNSKSFDTLCADFCSLH